MLADHIAEEDAYCHLNKTTPNEMSPVPNRGGKKSFKMLATES